MIGGFAMRTLKSYERYRGMWKREDEGESFLVFGGVNGWRREVSDCFWLDREMIQNSEERMEN